VCYEGAAYTTLFVRHICVGAAMHTQPCMHLCTRQGMISLLGAMGHSIQPAHVAGQRPCSLYCVLRAAMVTSV
jgi:hypothetical protein